jgi:hypothetical protein
LGVAVPKNEPNNDDRSGGKSPLLGVKDAATASNKLLSQLANQILKSFADPNVPREIKLFLAPLMFLIPLYSVVLVVLISEIAYCYFKNKDMSFYYYLMFFWTSSPTTLIVFLLYAVVSAKFENAKILEQQLQEVTTIRRPRAIRPR